MTSRFQNFWIAIGCGFGFVSTVLVFTALVFRTVGSSTYDCHVVILSAVIWAFAAGLLAAKRRLFVSIVALGLPTILFFVYLYVMGGMIVWLHEFYDTADVVIFFLGFLVFAVGLGSVGGLLAILVRRHYEKLKHT